MVHQLRRGWTALAVLVALGLLTLTLWTLASSRLVHADDTDAESDPVPPAENSAENAEGESAEPRPFLLPQPAAPPETEPREDFSKVLEVVFEKPFRRVRGREAAGRFDVTMRVRNISDEPVKGPLYLSISGSSFETLNVLNAPAVGEAGTPVFEVVAEDRALSPRARRGRALVLSFETEDELDAEKLAEAELDHAFTRTALELAEPAKSSPVARGRGRGVARRSLPIPHDDPALVATQRELREQSAALWSLDGVSAISTGVDAEGNLVQYVDILRLGVKKKLPAEIGGVPVVTRLTWGMRPRGPNDPNNRGTAVVPQPPTPGPPPICPDLDNCPNDTLGTYDPAGSGVYDGITFTPVIPIGAQIRNDTDNFTGTFGFIGLRGDIRYIVSNNHVIGDNNDATLGELITQPFGGTDIATLTQIVVIDFTTRQNGGANLVDAAMGAIITPNARRISPITHCAGYGAMSSRTGIAQLGDLVAKCGARTGCTQGRITSINSETNVAGAGYVDQLEMTGPDGEMFSDAGDSGSAIVRQGSNELLGLLFAGGPVGGQDFTIANKIDNVLQALSITHEGIPAGCPLTPVPDPGVANASAAP